MFFKAYSFNQPLDKWNTSNVQNMSKMFEYARSFNQSIDNWDTSSVKPINVKYKEFVSFNHLLDNWNINGVFESKKLFEGADSLNPGNKPIVKK